MTAANLTCRSLRVLGVKWHSIVMLVVVILATALDVCSSVPACNDAPPLKVAWYSPSAVPLTYDEVSINGFFSQLSSCQMD